MAQDVRCARRMCNCGVPLLGCKPIYVPLLGTGLLSEQEGLGHSSHAGPVRIGNFARTIESLRRAICGRIENHLQSLPPPFRLQRPLLARAASTEARTPARAPSFSVCWASTEPLPEVINATTGKLESGQPSLLCKQSMFARWQHLVTRLPLLPQDPESAEPAGLPDKPDALLYNEAKQLCPAYQVAKERLIEAFDKAKLGRWIKKPIEQDQFICEIVDAPTHALFA
ncbi:hypothetical protein MSG28_014785 [Choristoneura fumiferana]|uniref:Uncharacterized protein n=1 Tax=Choristoneura fumiferana TaxID=7141 RepID=A0ACC0JST1_CHOFU|nr:hypothetical protein MSG28_014785 [Choristoneura fumiferana]